MTHEMHTELAHETLLVNSAKKKRSCCKSIFSHICCCISKNPESSKKIWAKIWAKISGKPDFDPVYLTLLHLYSQQNSIEELDSCELSPTYSKPFREDLEFYVPQLW